MKLLFEQRDQSQGGCADVEFICTDGIEKAHKCVLALQPYFKSMFASGMLESKSNGKISLPYTQNVVRNALRMLYCREWEKEEISDLDKYFELVDIWLTE
jgi:hypothetical protein